MKHKTVNAPPGIAPLAVAGLTVRCGERTLVHDLSFTLAPGELLGLIGPNGAGKSTVLKAIAQLMPSRGDIRLHGEDVRRLPARERARRIAYLSQEERLHWPLTVWDLVALGRYPHTEGLGTARDTAQRAAVARALHVAEAWDLRSRRVDTLSGGERARVRLARALAVDAPVLLADEPVAALDPRQRLRIMALLRAQCRLGISLIVVLHELTLASQFCDRLLLLEQGAPAALGRAAEVLTAALIQKVYGVQALFGEHEGTRYVVPWAVAACSPRPGVSLAQADYKDTDGKPANAMATSDSS